MRQARFPAVFYRGGTSKALVFHRRDLPDDRAPTTAVAVWGLGVVWALLGWAGLLAPRWVALVLGAVAAQLAAGSTFEAGWGPGLGLVTAAAVVAAREFLGATESPAAWPTPAPRPSRR